MLPNLAIDYRGPMTTDRGCTEWSLTPDPRPKETTRGWGEGGAMFTKSHNWACGLTVAATVVFGGLMVSSCEKKNPVKPATEPRIIFNGTLSNAGMGVNTSGGLTHWVSVAGDSIRMAYPAGQSWGAVFITTGGDPIPQHRREDVRGYRLLHVELRGELDGQSVLIGMKDKDDPDDGSETKLRRTLTTQWQAVEIKLTDFATADLENLYVLVEFVFESTSETVSARNIKFLP